MDNAAIQTVELRPSGLWRHLPRGGALPEDVWRQRHRGILVLLWLHVPAVFIIAMAQDVGVAHTAVETGIVVALAALATESREHRRLSTIIAVVGLLTCSAELVHLSHGLIEMHFHYFVMVGVVTLYQDWQPFLLAIGYVVLQHGVAGVVSPESVYNHPEAVAQPWKWAAIHGLFILGMSAAGIITWRLNESLLEAATEREKALRASESELRASNEQLARSDALKGVFIGTVSHELNTPLTAITGFTQLLAQNWDSLSDEKRLEMLERIDRNSRMLGGLISEVLDFSRLERGHSRLRADPVNVGQLVAGVVDQLGVVLARHRVSVVVVEDATVDGDTDALTRVVSNLLTNAAKFSPDGATIHVTVGAEGSVGTVTIDDNGPGVPADERDLIFEPFYRGHGDEVISQSGTGVGLSVVKNLTEQMGGSVMVDGNAHEGARFVVRLPLTDRQRSS
ncbi:MAG: two-component system, NarL family, sensor histidine kinase BarA [Acidimicrobiaceae bacterium]|jgi:signal transduction histidine kinase